jgi:transglutaminase-like putative cysteine protease
MRSASSSPRGWDLPAALLLCAAMLTATTRLVATSWTDNLSIVQTIVLIGTLAGLALGASQFSRRTVFFFGFAFGLFVVPWQLGIILSQKVDWSDRLYILLIRLGVIVYQLINHQTIRDSLLFLVLMSILFWVIGVSSGYVLVRYSDAWKAIIPGGLAMFVIHSFDPLVTRRAWYLAFYLFFGLVLVARMAFVHQHNRWQESRTVLPPHLNLDFIRFTLLFASIIVLLAWNAPALAQALPAAQKIWQPVRNTWTNTIDNFQNAFASLRSTVPELSPIYGNSATLGRGGPLSNKQVFTIHAPIDAPAGVRFYWRARVYDAYDNGQWYSTINTDHNYDPSSEEIILSSGVGRWEGYFDFTSAIYMGTIFTPAQPVWVSQAGQAQYVENPDGTYDVASFVAMPSIPPGKIYQVKSSLSAATVSQLRNAGTEYPDWIIKRYLQLPASVTPRTRQLAEQITAGLETPYDKTVAITNYLRKNITYIEEITEPIPEDQEPIDWFLFDSKKGFCNYYATAEVILLRAVGIPARWSIGYAQGELTVDDTARSLEAEQLTYLVRNKDAHAWPEIYFPTIGWVEFEPTAAQPEIIRFADDQAIPPLNSLLPANTQDPNDLLDANSDEGNSPVTPLQPQQDPVRIAIVASIIVLIVIGLLAMGGWYLLPLFGYPALPVLLERAMQRLGFQPPQALQNWASRSEKRQVVQLEPVPLLLDKALARVGFRSPKILQNWVRWATLPPLARAYSEINRALFRLGQPASATDTPAERATNLGKLVPSAEGPAHRLVQEYQVATFSRQPADLQIAQQSAKEIRRLSFKAVFQQLLARWQVPERQRYSLTKRGN